MVTDILFPFFEIFVNRIFGSIGLSLAALAAIIVAILGLCKASWVFILYWIIFFVMVVMTFYVGAIGMVICLALAMVYFFIQLVRLVSPDR